MCVCVIVAAVAVVTVALKFLSLLPLCRVCCFCCCCALAVVNCGSFVFSFYLNFSFKKGGMSTPLADETFSKEIAKKLTQDGALQDPARVAKGMVMAVARLVFRCSLSPSASHSLFSPSPPSLSSLSLSLSLPLHLVSISSISSSCRCTTHIFPTPRTTEVIASIATKLSSVSSSSCTLSFQASLTRSTRGYLHRYLTA